MTVWPAKLKVFYCLVFHRKTISTPILAKFHEERVLILFVLRILYSKQKSSCRIHKGLCQLKAYLKFEYIPDWMMTIIE